jgi:hypothetical protein
LLHLLTAGYGTFSAVPPAPSNVGCRRCASGSGSPLQRDDPAGTDHIRIHAKPYSGISDHGIVGGVIKEPRRPDAEGVAALEIAEAGGEGKSAARLQVCGAAEGESEGGASACLAIVVDDLRLQKRRPAIGSRRQRFAADQRSRHRSG